MKVVITGATGFIGRQLVRALITGGHEVHAFSRDTVRAHNELPAKCRVFHWDPSAARIDHEALRGADAAIHLAGEGVADARWTAQRKAAILASRIDGSRVLVEALRALPPAERPRTLIAASAIGFYGNRGDEELDETAQPGTGYLAEVCQAWEAEMFKAKRLGMRTVAVRVGVVLGTHGGALQRMLPLFRLGVAGRIGSGRQWMSWIHLDDIIRLFLHALDHEDVTGIVNGVAPQAVTNTDFTAALADALHRPALLPVPATALRLALGEMSDVVLASHRVIPRAASAHDFVFEYPRLDRALSNLCNDLADVFEAEQWVPLTPDEVFPFFSDAHNLEKLTPKFLGFRVLRTSTPVIEEGTTIDYRLSLHGIPMRWQSRIERWELNRSFVDVQVRGPYRLWHHTHEFEPYAGGTIIRDRVRYELPVPPFGQLAAGALVRKDLAAIFAFRRATVATLFGEPPSAPESASA